MPDTAIRNDELPAEVALALQKGNKIEAIKLLRLAKRIDLKDAKQIIDGVVAQDPRLRRRPDAADGRGRFALVLIALALLAFLYSYLTRG
jgi:hypothetical protein